MKQFLSFCCFLSLSVIGLHAQPAGALVAYYSFDDCDLIDDDVLFDDSRSGSNGSIIGNPLCECGVEGNSVRLDGVDDNIVLLGQVSNIFDIRNFSISLYIKPIRTAGAQSNQVILSKRETPCSANKAFEIEYQPTSARIVVTVSENTSKRANVSGQLNGNFCWQHIVFVRRNETSLLYINGELVDQTSAVSTVDLFNNTSLTISNSPCLGSLVSRFSGFIDEMRVYNRVLDAREVLELYVEPDQIVTKDQTIFLGQDIQTEVNSTCADVFEWTPTTNLSDPSDIEPILSPEQTTTYYLRQEETGLCQALDSVVITVIDPDDLDCNAIFLPKAFTPNADGLNDEFGISNPFAIDELIVFEIFDRWGGKVFSTTDPFARWDGTFEGQRMNPGVLLYRVQFRCNGEEDVQVGSLSIVR